MKDYKSYFHKILQSEEFSGSTKYQDLFTYLYNSKIQGTVPKEVTIAHEVFGAEVDDKEDHNVRVYVYNLRKKLASYYVKEGAEDSIQFVIPKGRYKLEFVEKTQKTIKTQKILLYSVIGLCLILAAGLIYVTNTTAILKEYKSHAVRSEFVWKGFINNDLPTLVVIGDYHLISDIEDTSRIRFLRDIHINSENDLTNFLNNHPDQSGRFRDTRLTLLGKYAPVCANELGKLFFSTNVDYSVILGSEFHWKDIQNSNLVFIGSFKTLSYFKELFKDSNFQYNIFPNELIFHQVKNDSTYYYYAHDSNVNNAYETDYCLLVKLANINNSNLIFVLASRDIGLMAATKLITDPESLKSFEVENKSLLSKSSNFEACFKVQGLYRNDISIDLVNFNAIEKPIVFHPSYQE